MSNSEPLSVKPIVASSSLRTLAYEALKTAITNMDIYGRPDEVRLDERKLSQDLGVSRTPVREALTVLEQEGFVRSEARRGVFVIKKNKREIVSMIHAWTALESMAARLAAKSMTAEEIAGLRELLAFHERQEDLSSGEAYYQREGDLDFHYRIVQGSHNRMLMTLLCDDLYYLVRLYRTQFSAKGSRPQRAFVEHHRIVDAIEAGDAELAELLMRRHVSASRENVAAHYARTLGEEASDSPAIPRIES